MRPPTIKLARWKITYKQVPYDNRYFFVYLDNYFLYKVSNVYISVLTDILPYDFVIQKNKTLTAQERWAAFLIKVCEYNKELDQWEYE